MGDLKEYADRLKFEIMAADFLTTEDREMVFDLMVGLSAFWQETLYSGKFFRISEKSNRK